MSYNGSEGSMKHTLPDALSAGIRLALQDLRKAEKNPSYKVLMGVWHGPLSWRRPRREACAVCLAGAVMAFSLNVPKNKNMLPFDFEDDVIKHKLLALDYARQGSIALALYCYSNFAVDNNIFRKRQIPRYPIDRPGFYRAMNRLARDLERRGL